MSQKPCPNCGWCHPRAKPKAPVNHANNTTPIEILIDETWTRFPSVAQAARERGIKRTTLFTALRGGLRQKIKARLAGGRP